MIFFFIGIAIVVLLFINDSTKPVIIECKLHDWAVDERIDQYRCNKCHRVPGEIVTKNGEY